MVEVDAVQAGFARNHFGRFGRDHATARLGACQRHLGIDVALNQRLV